MLENPMNGSDRLRKQAERMNRAARMIDLSPGNELERQEELLLLAADLGDALREVEWIYTDEGSYCPCCGRREGHREDCTIHLALARLDAWGTHEP